VAIFIRVSNFSSKCYRSAVTLLPLRFSPSSGVLCYWDLVV